MQACQDDLVYEKSWVCQIVLLLAQILEQLIKVRSVRIVRDVLFAEKIVPVTHLYLHHHQRGIANELGQAVKVSFLCIVYHSLKSFSQGDTMVPPNSIINLTMQHGQIVCIWQFLVGQGRSCE